MDALKSLSRSNTRRTGPHKHRPQFSSCLHFSCPYPSFSSTQKLPCLWYMSKLAGESFFRHSWQKLSSWNWIVLLHFSKRWKFESEMQQLQVKNLWPVTSFRLRRVLWHFTDVVTEGQYTLVFYVGCASPCLSMSYSSIWQEPLVTPHSRNSLSESHQSQRKTG